MSLIRSRPVSSTGVKRHANPILADRGEPAVDLTALDAKTVHAKNVRHRTRKITDHRRTETARDALADFQRDVELFGFTKGQFSLIQLIRAVLDHTGPADLTMSTWTAAKFDAQEVHELLEAGLIRRTRWLVDFSFQRRAPGIAGAVRELFGADAIRVAWNHAKFALIRNESWAVVIRTSMNLNTNPRFEDFTVAHDPELADFLDGMLDEIWNRQEKTLRLAKAGEVQRHFDEIL